jgi:SRSO17 transposase
MDGGPSEGSEARSAAYVEAPGVVFGHADRREPMPDDCLGLLMPIARKSVEPTAAITGRGEASIFVLFCWQRAAVGRGDAGQGERARAARD